MKSIILRSLRLFRIRVSLRISMALILILGGWLGWMAHKARVQHEAVAAIQRSRGHLAYNWQWYPTGEPRVLAPQHNGPRWLRERIGRDYLDTLTYAKMFGRNCDDTSLRAACRVTSLQDLSVMDSPATDAGIEDLGRLRSLRSLNLSRNQMTSRCLPTIGKLNELRELTLALKIVSGPSDSGNLDFLHDLVKLERLVLTDENLNDACLVSIASLPNLRILELDGTAITSTGLASVGSLSQLSVFCSMACGSPAWNPCVLSGDWLH